MNPLLFPKSPPDNVFHLQISDLFLMAKMPIKPVSDILSFNSALTSSFQLKIAFSTNPLTQNHPKERKTCITSKQKMCNLLTQLSSGIGDLNTRLKALSAAADATIASQRLLINKNKNKGNERGVTAPSIQTTGASAAAKNKFQVSSAKVDTSKAWICCGCQGINETTDDPCWRCDTSYCDCCLVKKK